MGRVQILGDGFYVLVSLGNVTQASGDVWLVLSPGEPRVFGLTEKEKAEVPKADQTVVGHKAAVQSVAISKDGRRLVTAGADTSILIWDIQTGVSCAQGNVSRWYLVSWTVCRALTLLKEGGPTVQVEF